MQELEETREGMSVNTRCRGRGAEAVSNAIFLSIHFTIRIVNPVALSPKQEYAVL